MASQDTALILSVSIWMKPLQQMDWMWRPNNLPPHYRLDSIGFLSLGVHVKPGVRDSSGDLVARTAVAAGTIREVPEIFQKVQHNIARRCRTCNEVGGRHFEQLLQCKTTITSPKTYASSRKLLCPLVPQGIVSARGCINKRYDQIEHIYLPQSVVTYIYLHPV
jgi:hypothetical protein